MKHVPITLKLNILILISLVVGIGTIAAYLGISLTQTIDEATQTSLEQEADIVYEAIEQLMLPGEAPLVVNYFRGIAELDPRLRIYLYRTDGTAAFSDGTTIEAVNSRLGMDMFLPRQAGTSASMAPPLEMNDAFLRATAPPARTQVFREVHPDTTVVRHLRPLINLPKCTECHGSDHTVRGVIDIHADIGQSITRQRNAIMSASGAFLILVAIVGLGMSRYLRRRVIAPMKEIGATCEAVTTGDFSRRSTVATNDELGVLSRTVNAMVEGLYERFVLSRYVSGSTLSALAEGGGSRTETLTFLFSDIRGFTAFSETHPPEEVVDTLNAILADQSDIIAAHGGDIDKYVGDEIVAVFDGKDGTERAIAASQAIQQRLTQDESRRFGGLAVGIGINRGPVIVGEIGSRNRADFTAVGDNVNVAARLCSGARAGEILVSDRVRQSIETSPEAVSETTEVSTEVSTGTSMPPFILDGPYRMRVKGKAQALRVFRVLTPTQGQDDDIRPEDASP